MDNKRCHPEDNLCVECFDDSQCADGSCSEQNRCIPDSCMDAYEPNEDLMTARPLPINGRRIDVSGLYVCSDRDWYSLNLNGGENVLLTINFIDEMGDIDAKLLDAQGETLLSRLTSTDNEYFGIPNATAGTYYLEVYGIGNTINTYSISADLNSIEPVCSTDDQCGAGTCDARDAALCRPEGYCDQNRDCDEAAPICNVNTQRCEGCNGDALPASTEESPIPAQEANGKQLNLCGGPDFFFVEAGQGQTINVQADFSHMNGDVDVRIQDQEGASVASSITVTDQELINHVVETAGLFIIKVYTVGGTYNEYRLSVSVQ